ncbi:methyltransferase [Clostridiaceae bacterium 14S0207]|nr:methyltransferase [Clostridiaceae bacterium 14S0207]
MMNTFTMIFKIILAGVLAGIIGLERELHSKEAGFRTHFLVGVGSALIMIISKYGFLDILGHTSIGLDPSRMASQVVSGIGFLGAGTIIIERKVVKGLTTAAGIWVTAGIGLAIGSGLYWIGIFCTLVVFVGLEGLQKLFRLTTSKTLDVSITLLEAPIYDLCEVLSQEKCTISFYKMSKYVENNKEFYIIECRIRIKNNINSLELIERIQKLENVSSVNVETL